MEAILVGVVVGLVGIFIGIYLHQNATISSKLESIRQILERLPAQSIVPSGISYLLPLAREARFWERLYQQRADKVIISRKIATSYITRDDRTIIVDSGTTVDQIPYMLCQEERQLEVFTNNILAAVSVVPPPPGFDCRLLPGRIDPIYGATYNIGAIGEPLKQIKKADKIILACTAMSFEKGPLVTPEDNFNQEFKGQLVRKALDDPTHTQLIIATDWTKFDKDEEVVKGMIPVVQKDEWKQVKARREFVLVVTDPGELKTQEAKRAKREIDRFKDNSARGKMQTDVLPPC